MGGNIRVLLMTSKTETRDFYVASAPPLGIYWLRHYLSKRGIECDILDLSVHWESEEEYVWMAAQGYYDIIGISATHQNMIPELETIWRFRIACKKNNKKCLFIAGGYEAVLNHAQWLESGINLILLGFAAKALYELCIRLSDRSDTELIDLVKGMDGYVLRDKNNQIIYSPTRILTESEFGELAFYQSLEIDIPYQIYWNELRKVSTELNFHSNIFIAETVRLYTSSHCIWNCGFCASRSFIPKSQNRQSSIIMLSASEVHQLIVHHINKYGAKSFLFSDDDFFNCGKKGIERIHDLCRLIIESKNNDIIPKDTVFNCQTRIDDFLIKKNENTVNLELMDVLKKAGFHSFGLGIETFSDRLLQSRSINKKSYTEKDCRNVLNALLQKGLVPTINIILAIPESTVEDMIHSIEIAVGYFQKECQIAVTPIMDSFPGSSIHGSKDYEVTTKKWKNPYTKEVVTISDYFVPRDKKIKGVIGQLRGVSSEEQEKIKIDCSWTRPVIPKPIVGLSLFIGISRLLGEHNLAQHIRDIACNALQKDK